MPRLIRGLWKHANGFWYFSRMRQGVRRTVALETKSEDEAIRKALEISGGSSAGLVTWLPGSGSGNAPATETARGAGFA